MARFRGQALACLRGGRLVFHGLDFDLSDGDLLLLVGPNGSGKSTLLRVMAGLLRASDGTLTWDDEPLDEDPDAHRGRVRYMGHLDAVKPVLSAADNLLDWARIQGVPRSEAPERVAAALRSVRMDHLWDLAGYMLSAGQKRRLNLARTLLTPARLWLLDEPTVGLDRDSVATLRAEIAARRSAGAMVVLSTHGELATPGAITDAKRLDLAAFTPALEDAIPWAAPGLAGP